MDGALIIDKPGGLTSHDVVARVRRAARTRRVGHAGTLDPFATGVLVVCVNRATRLVQFLVGLDKEYTAVVRLGFATATQDLTGQQITPLKSSHQLTRQDLIEALEGFKGDLLQLPPMYSAKKVAGERLHKAAREGREVERSPVRISVHSIALLDGDRPLFEENEDGTRDVAIRVRCSSGTYVRTLAHDLGERLGVGAHLSALRRTKVGRFDIAGALALDEVEAMAEQGALMSELVEPAQMLAHLPAVRLDSERVKRIVNGRAIALLAEEAAAASARQPLRLCDEGGALVAVGEYDGQRREAKPRVVLS